MEHELFPFGTIPSGKEYLFRISILSGNFPVQRTKKVCHLQPKRNIRNLLVNGKRPTILELFSLHAQGCNPLEKGTRRFSVRFIATIRWIRCPAGGGGECTPLYKLCRYVPLQRVWFLITMRSAKTTARLTQRNIFKNNISAGQTSLLQV